VKRQGFHRATACRPNATHGIANGLSVCQCVCLSICLTNACIVTKRKKLVTRRMVGGADPSCLKLWVKLTLLERKREFLIDIRS